jgi:SUKH-3 immunity protein
MTRTELNSKSLSILTAKGWDRSPRNIDRDLVDLKEGGFNFPPSYVLSFLQTYSGIEFETNNKNLSSLSIVNFGLEKAFEIPCVKADVTDHEIILGKKLYPIGSMDLFKSGSSNSYATVILLMAEDENIYVSVSYTISLAGYDSNDFINRVIDAQMLWEINDDLMISYSAYDPRLLNHKQKEKSKV